MAAGVLLLLGGGLCAAVLVPSGDAYGGLLFGALGLYAFLVATVAGLAAVLAAVLSRRAHPFARGRAVALVGLAFAVLVAPSGAGWDDLLLLVLLVFPLAIGLGVALVALGRGPLGADGIPVEWRPWALAAGIVLLVDAAATLARLSGLGFAGAPALWTVLRVAAFGVPIAAAVALLRHPWADAPRGVALGRLGLALVALAAGAAPGIPLVGALVRESFGPSPAVPALLALVQAAAAGALLAALRRGAPSA